jgi:predicted DNA-binding antitoxin AbrB/MazE fold protein
MSQDINAVYDQGVLRPLEPLILRDGTRVRLHIEESAGEDGAKTPPAQMRSPRLVRPEQAAEFAMEVREIADAGL